MTKVCMIAAALLGFLAIVVIAFLAATAFGILLALLCAVAAVGAAFFRGLQAAEAGIGDNLAGERIVAYGIGRGGRGFLGAHAVVVTEGGIRSVAANPWGPGASSNPLRFADVKRLDSGSDSLLVDGAGTRLKLRKCPPAQVAALESVIRERIR